MIPLLSRGGVQGWLYMANHLPLAQSLRLSGYSSLTKEEILVYPTISCICLVPVWYPSIFDLVTAQKNVK